MDQTEAYELARKELDAVQKEGFGAASGLIDTLSQRDVTAPSGDTYEVELSYLWEDEEREEILVICRVTDKSWFKPEQVEQSITLQCGIHR